MFPLFLAFIQAASPVPTAVAAKPVKEKQICVYEEVTGSRVKGKRMCYTKAEYDEYLAKLKAMLAERQRTGYFQESKGSCTKGVDC